MIDMSMAPGIAHAVSARMASSGPPNFMPMEVMVWVVEGPGKMLQKALISVSSSAVKNLCLSTSLRLKWGKCNWGPPKAVNPNQKTDRIKVICFAVLIFVPCCMDFL